MTKRRTADDWGEIFDKIISLIQSGEIGPSLQGAAEYLNIPYKSLYQGIKRWNPEFSTDELHQYATTKEGGINHDKKQNTWTITANHPAIHTLDQLIEYCEVDLDIWEVDHWIGNAWETPAKKKVTDLTFDEGKISGEIYSDGEMTSKTNMQIKAWFIRKVPIPFFPHIQPIETNITFPKPKKPIKKKLYRWLFIADIQTGFRRNIHTGKLIPFHDRRVLDIALQILGHKEFDGVGFLGDELDLSEWSTRFVSEPEFSYTTMPALIECNWWLSQYRNVVPNAEMVMLDNNHNRFAQAILGNLRAAYDLRPADELEMPPTLSIERMLALDKLHIKFIGGYKDGTAKYWLTDTIVLQHSNIAKSGSGDTAKDFAGKYVFTNIFGHVHRRELVSKKMRMDQDNWRTYTAFCPGCACHIDGRVPGSTEDSQWQQGLGVIEFSKEDANRPPHIIPVEVTDGIAIYDGQIFEAADNENEIEEVLNAGLEKMGTS